MAAPKAAIIGVLGQDGGYLARLLVNKGYEVHGTSRAPERVGSSPLQALGLHRQNAAHQIWHVHRGFPFKFDTKS
jgi:GDPmannose 4,6-dehydratase